MKYNNITDATKILLFAATVIITCILVTLGFQAAEAAKQISNSAVMRMDELNGDLQNSNIKMYDETEVYGSDVINFIKKNMGDYSTDEEAPIFVEVKTALSKNTYSNKEYLSEIRDFSSNKYIKPTSVFLGKVCETDNKVIVGITFTQQ